MPAVFLNALKTILLAAFLSVIAVAAAMEYVDLPTPHPTGSSPINPGQFGTSMFVEMLRNYGFRVSYVSDWSYVRGSSAGEKVCVLLISPEYSYTYDEVEAIIGVLKASGGVLVVADETTVSNALLELLGVRARVYGNRLLDEYYGFYPRSTFYVEDREIALRLDKASEIRNCSAVVGVAESYSYPSAVAEVKPVGCIEHLDNLAVLVLGDGSLLTNQAQQLGGTYRELAKFVALTIKKYCGTECRVLVEAGKYSSNRNVFLTLATQDESASFLVFLNDVLYYLKAFKDSLDSDPLEGLREEAVAVSILLSVVALSAKLGKGSTKLTKTLGSSIWRGREDFSKIYGAIIDVLTSLGCEPRPNEELTRCLERAGYEPRRSRGLIRFMKVSGFVLKRRIFSYLPIWQAMIGRALKYSEELLAVLERSL